MTCTPEDVRNITGSVLTDQQIAPFILDAECIIEVASECVTVTAACQDRACVNLTAHYLVSSQVGKASLGVKRENLEGVYEVTYVTGSESGTGVMATSYGKKANALMGGCLQEMDKSPISLNTIGAEC
tara:strand:- start:96 stop:479 length:384 start_codon:yes stop_codon:yes gene_type:complete